MTGLKKTSGTVPLPASQGAKEGSCASWICCSRAKLSSWRGFTASWKVLEVRDGTWALRQQRWSRERLGLGFLSSPRTSAVSGKVFIPLRSVHHGVQKAGESHTWWKSRHGKKTAWGGVYRETWKNLATLAVKLKIQANSQEAETLPMIF